MRILTITDVVSLILLSSASNTRLLILETLQGAHGFVKTHRWSNTIEAFINVEASGTGGPGMLFHTIAIILAIILPVVFAIMRLLFSSYALSWFGHPHLAFLMFAPCSLVGLLIPGIVWRHFSLSQNSSVLNMPEEDFDWCNKSMQ